MIFSRGLGALSFLGVATALSACGDYSKAAVGAGVAVASVAVYRAVTGDCWASCRPGLVCDEKSGLCEPGECAPGCPVGTHCVRTVHGDLVCVRAAGTFTRGGHKAAPVRHLDAGTTIDDGGGKRDAGGAHEGGAGR